MTTIKFRDWDCVIEKSKYTNGRPALILNDAHDGEQIAVATVNLPNVQCRPNQVFIKDYSELEGLLEALEAAGVLKATGQTVSSGYVSVPVCELQPPFRERSPLAEALGIDPDKKPEPSRSRDTGRGR
jgi:hypothetical protein